jgi:DNA polymerase-3 subunit delta'
MSTQILPWHQANWQALQKRLSDRTLPHALLLTGPAGLGKSLFTQAFIQSLLCENRSKDKGSSCGQCKPCNLYTANTHPDIYMIGLEEDSKLIKIDQMRALTEKLGLKSQMGGYRVTVINPADRMNKNAANSLLKTLEEPGEYTILILVTDRPGQLPATIRSRCQQMSFASPSHETALEWLKQELAGTSTQPDLELLLALSGGAPLKALTMLEEDKLTSRMELLQDLSALIQGQSDPVAIAEKWFKNDLENSLEWVTSWIGDIIQLKMAPNPPNLKNPDQLKYLKTMANNLELRWLYSFYDKLKQAGRLAETTVNRQLLLEDLLIMCSSRKHLKVG